MERPGKSTQSHALPSLTFLPPALAAFSFLSPRWQADTPSPTGASNPPFPLKLETITPPRRRWDPSPVQRAPVIVGRSRKNLHWVTDGNPVRGPLYHRDGDFLFLTPPPPPWFCDPLGQTLSLHPSPSLCWRKRRVHTFQTPLYSAPPRSPFGPPSSLSSPKFARRSIPRPRNDVPLPPDPFNRPGTRRHLLNPRRTAGGVWFSCLFSSFFSP